MARSRPRVQIQGMTRPEHQKAQTVFMRAYWELKRRGKSDDASYRAAYLKAYGPVRYAVKYAAESEAIKKKDKKLASAIRVPTPSLRKPPSRR